MSKISRLKRLEEAIERKTILKKAEQSEAEFLNRVKNYCEHHPGKPRPTTRREFIGAGLFTMSTSILGPSLLSILGQLSPEAQAQVLGGECPAPVVGANAPTPFINLHIAGGMAPLSIVTPRTTAGAALPSYTRLGLGAAPQFVNNVFANRAEMFDNGVGLGFLRGLQAGAPATTLANAALVTVPVRDNGDSQQNWSILGLVERAGRAGSKLSFLRHEAGQDRQGQAATGINGSSAFGAANVAVNPIVIQSTQALLSSVTAAGALGQLTNAQQLSLARTIQNLNAEQAARITGLNGGQEMAKLVRCATDQNIKNLAGGGAALDPRQVTGMAGIWNNFANVGGNQRGGVFNGDAIAAVVNNVLNGNAAGAAINVGAFDIHADCGGTRVNQETGHFNVGLTVGRILESARLLNTKVFIQLSTNGAVVNAGGTPTSAFNADDNIANCFGATHFIMYNPAAPVATMSQLPQQIGGLTATGNVDVTVFTSNVADGMAAIFYNYVLFSTGNEAVFDRVMTGIRQYTPAQKAIMRKVA